MARQKRKYVAHGEPRAQFGKAISTPSTYGSQTITIPCQEGDVFTVSTFGSSATTVTLDLIDAYDGLEIYLILTSAVGSDAWASAAVKLNGTAATLDYTEAIDDSAINMCKISVISTLSGASKVVITTNTIA